MLLKASVDVTLVAAWVGKLVFGVNTFTAEKNEARQERSGRAENLEARNVFILPHSSRTSFPYLYHFINDFNCRYIVNGLRADMATCSCKPSAGEAEARAWL